MRPGACMRRNTHSRPQRCSQRYWTEYREGGSYRSTLVLRASHRLFVSALCAARHTAATRDITRLGWVRVLNFGTGRQEHSLVGVRSLEYFASGQRKNPQIEAEWPGAPRQPLTCDQPVMPGLTRWRCAYMSVISHPSRSSVRMSMACGRGPTSDMSPLSTLNSCGSSSMLDARRRRPIRVKRSSRRLLEAFGPSSRIPAHGAEFVDFELAVVMGVPPLLENDGTRTVDFDGDCDEYQNRQLDVTADCAHAGERSSSSRFERTRCLDGPWLTSCQPGRWWEERAVPFRECRRRCT